LLARRVRAPGDILLDGMPLTSLHPASVHRFIGSVAQEPVLFSGSIAENMW
jgi:ABC-type bacteriocin/lantibiotic exporter with double-glycine peptidase domain